jgi:hypothetical protein
MSSIVRISTLYPQAGDKLWITVDRARFFVGNLLKTLPLVIGKLYLHSAAHSFKVLSHSLKPLNKGFELLFYRLSTALPASYYYYLYIYKFRFQADHPQIKVLQNNIYMSARATA